MSGKEPDEATVEHVARALHEAHKPWCDYEYDFEDPMSSQHVYEALARAALAAIGSGTQGRDAVIKRLERELADERMEHGVLQELLSRPQIDDFWEGIVTEAAHQRQRWGDAHDRDKSAENWFWLIGYLSGKALRAAIDGDKAKAQHHTISTAAALFQWHKAISADDSGCGAGKDEDIDPDAGRLGDEPSALASPEKVTAPTHYMTTGEQQIMHRALRASTRPVEPTPPASATEFTRDAFNNYMAAKRAIPPAAGEPSAAATTFARANWRQMVISSRDAAFLLDAFAAAIRAEAKAEGWEKAMTSCRKSGFVWALWAADWLAANRPSPTGREDLSG